MVFKTDIALFYGVLSLKIDKGIQKYSDEIFCFKEFLAILNGVLLEYFGMF